ncbi:MAG: hypothetical protein MI794_05685 [Pseudomonadales bacterium]|nr:hypothetical protein [Pseudomonadales bacterium]
MKHEATLPPLPRSLKLGLLATLGLFLTLLAINQLLVSPVASKGIVDLELASNAERTLAILASWGEQGMLWAQVSLWLDFLFIAIYVVSLLALTGYLLQDRPGIRERKVGHSVRALFVGAGVCDVAENVLLLNNLSAPSDSVSLAAALCAMIKFTALLLGGAGLLVIRAERRHPLETSR